MRERERESRRRERGRRGEERRKSKAKQEAGWVLICKSACRKPRHFDDLKGNNFVTTTAAKYQRSFACPLKELNSRHLCKGICVTSPRNYAHLAKERGNFCFILFPPILKT